MPKKSLFKTKTAFSQYVLATAGALTAFKPDAVPWVSANAGLIMLGASLVNIIIRKLTHEQVSLFASADGDE